MATANSLQPRNGLLDMMGQGDSAFAGWLDPRRNAIINFGTGLIGADSARDAMRGAAQGLQTGRQQDTAYALLQQEQAEKQQALQEQTQQRNATLEYLQRTHPDLAQAVTGGMSVGDAWSEAIARSRPQASEPFTLGEGDVRYDGNGNIIAGSPEPEGPNIDVETKLRTEYQGQQSYKDYVQQEQAYQRVLDSAHDASPAGDLALIFNYMKVLDPGSVVRESEFATAAASGAFGDRIQAAVQQVTSGERLSPAMRRDFVERAGDLFRGATDLYGGYNDRYSGLATQYGVDPTRVIRPGAQIGIMSPGWNIDQFLSGGIAPSGTTSSGVPWSIE